MSDQTPPPTKPKPGSLRDRIAAFENKGTAPAGPAGPPAPRPKPGGIQWKPRPPSPPTVPDNVPSSERKPPSTGGMSASDAMESIGRGGSLKERMAALQGKGGFGGGAPPPVAPKPNVERPKWKPPPAVPAPVSSQDEDEGVASVDTGGRTASRSPPPRVAVSPTPANQGASNQEGDAIAHEGATEDADPEEEERQRRAAIAARMARLGGARFGMGPPIFAPKPVVRKSEQPPPAPEAREEEHADQPALDKDSSEALVSSPPHDLPGAASPAREAIAETEHKDEHEPSPPVPTRAPVAMPVPAGPRRAAPPRKKPSKNAPTGALPEPPVEEAAAVVAQSPPTTDEPTASVDHTVHDTSLTIGDLQEISGVAEAATDDHLNTTTEAERRPLPPAPVEAFHQPVEEPEKQEAEEEHVENADDHVEEELVQTTADDQQVPSDQFPEVAEVEEEDEEARRQRVAARLAQMGAFNPLAGFAPIPRRQSRDEQGPAEPEEPLDVEDDVNVDTQEHATSPPPTIPERYDGAPPIQHDAAEPHIETDQDDAQVDEDDQVPAHRDGERTIASYAEEQDGDRHDVPSSLEFSEQPPIEHEPAHAVARQEQSTASVQQTEPYGASGTASLEGDEQGTELQGDANDALARGTTAETEPDISKDEAEENELPARITRFIPPPPVNFQSKPKPFSPPPLSPPPRTSLQALRADDEDRPASPDMPPRPVPPPGRSSSMIESPPRRSIPPPPRRSASVRVTESLASPPLSLPPVPTSPPAANRRPLTPPIITTLAVQEQGTSEEHESEVVTEEPLETRTPQPEVQEDEASSRRRAIAERMARLGGIRFGAPPAMSPLSRPPLPAAPPPTSIPPDETESEEREEEGPREEEENEAARRQRIAAKLAGMGGMRFGMLPPTAGLPPTIGRLVTRQEDSESEDAVPPVPVPAPLQRLPPTRKPPPPIEPSVEQESEQARRGSHGTSDDGVRVEAEESEMEEVRYSDAEDVPRRSTETPRSAEVLPTPPPRVTSRSPPPGRPPIPIIPATLLGRRPSATARSLSVSSSRKTSMEEEPSFGETPTMSESVMRPPSEYVMVEAEDPDLDDTSTPPPHRRSTRGPARSIPSLPPVPPPSAIDPPETLTGSAQWELPSIPQGIEFGEGSELASSGWSEDSTVVHVPPPVVSSPPGSRRHSSKLVTRSSISGSSTGTGIGSGSGSGSGFASSRRSTEQQQQQPQLTTDELMTVWGRVGAQVVDAATTLFDKSKRALVGDGSYAGFVRAVLAQIPGVVYPGANDADDWGYVVYAQTGNAVQRRVSDILPGDVIAFDDAKLKGHKGLHTYTQTVGTTGSGPFVGIVSEFDAKKSKVRVWQANQHVGQQTVENVSYRLEDLKSGQVKVYRVLDA